MELPVAPHASIGHCGAVHLEPFATADLTMAAPHVIGDGPAGTRIVVGLEDGIFTGSLAGRLKGRSGADWLTVGPDGTGLLDVRLVVETDDGSLVYVTAHGRIDLSPGAAGAPALLATTFEASTASTAWLNRVLAVTRADTTGTRLAYTVMAVVSD
jgi:hypothetical protein